MKASEFSALMPVDVFNGGTGNLVICQEWPATKGDRYVRVMVPMDEARQLAESILAVVRENTT